MTDEEVICEWMEPDAPKDGRTPPRNEFQLNKFSPNGWWRYSMLACLWKQPILHTCPPVECLGRLWEVEERLIGLGYRTHIAERLSFEVWRDAVSAATWHATPAQRIRALAVVLRPLVEIQPK